MSDLQTQFEAAAAAAQNLSKRPDNDTMLKLYSLYKQATSRGCAGQATGFHQPGRPGQVRCLEEGKRCGSERCHATVC